MKPKAFPTSYGEYKVVNGKLVNAADVAKATPPAPVPVATVPAPSVAPGESQAKQASA